MTDLPTVPAAPAEAAARRRPGRGAAAASRRPAPTGSS